MSKLIIMPAIEDIRLFQSGGHNRSTNDESNRIREEILANILYVDDEYLNHPEFGSLWTSLKQWGHRTEKVSPSMTPAQPLTEACSWQNASSRRPVQHRLQAQSRINRFSARLKLQRLALDKKL